MSFHFSLNALCALSELVKLAFYGMRAENSICDYVVYLQQQLVNSVCEESSEMLLWGPARRLLMRE